MVRPFLGLYAVSLGATVGLVGLIYGSPQIASFFISLPSSALADRLGNKFFIVFGMLLNFLGILAIVLLPTPELIIVGRVLQGVEFACFQPSMFTFLLRRLSERPDRKKLIGITLTGAPIGQFASPALGSLTLLLGGFLAAFTTGMVLAAASLLMGVALMRRDYSSVKPAGVKRMLPASGFRSVISRRLVPALSTRAANSYMQGRIQRFFLFWLTKSSSIVPLKWGLFLL